MKYGLRILISWFPLALSVALGVVSCGGGTQLAGGGIGGTGITSGTVTGFGSIFVNGIEFDTAGATRLVDDSSSVSNGTDDSSVLGQGMVITVSGTVNPDGRSGTALTVSYDEAVEGPVGDAPVENADLTAKTFHIFDLTVVASSTNTVYVNTGYASLAPDRVLEVSGFFDATGTLRATRIVDHGALSSGSTVQLKGMVSQFDGVDTFRLGTTVVHFDGTTLFTNLPGGVMDGEYVEAVGTLNSAGMINATRIDQKQPGLALTGDVSLEGIVSDFNGTADFRVSGQPVDASAAAFVPTQLGATLADDQRVEVDGVMDAGVLVATRVAQRAGSVNLAGRVVSTNPVAGTLQVEVVSGQPSVSVSTDSRTQMEDEVNDLERFTVADLGSGDEVVIEGYEGNTGAVIARQLERNNLNRYELQGPVDQAAGNALSGSVTILGVTMQTDQATAFEDVDDQAFANGGDDFFGRVQPGDLVKVEDNVPLDGVADEVEFEH
jgi:hypothetical protein